MNPTEHLKQFRHDWHLVCPDDTKYRPNWMKLTFHEELTRHQIVVIIDVENPDARRALGALIGHLWISCENWTITTTRPD